MSALPAKFVIYLLHFDRPMGRVRHYVGITRRERLAKRMHEHQGTGASQVTARAARLVNAFTLAATFDADSHADEQRFKKAGHFDKRCPICRGVLDLGGTRLRFEPRSTEPPGGDWSGIAHPPSKTKSEHPPNERPERPTRSGPLNANEKGLFDDQLS